MMEIVNAHRPTNQVFAVIDGGLNAKNSGQTMPANSVNAPHNTAGEWTQMSFFHFNTRRAPSTTNATKARCRISTMFANKW